MFGKAEVPFPTLKCVFIFEFIFEYKKAKLEQFNNTQYETGAQQRALLNYFLLKRIPVLTFLTGTNCLQKLSAMIHFSTFHNCLKIGLTTSP